MKRLLFFLSFSAACQFDVPPSEVAFVGQENNRLENDERPEIAKLKELVKRAATYNEETRENLIEFVRLYRFLRDTVPLTADDPELDIEMAKVLGDYYATVRPPWGGEDYFVCGPRLRAVVYPHFEKAIAAGKDLFESEEAASEAYRNDETDERFDLWRARARALAVLAFWGRDDDQYAEALLRHLDEQTPGPLVIEMLGWLPTYDSRAALRRLIDNDKRRADAIAAYGGHGKATSKWLLAKYKDAKQAGKLEESYVYLKGLTHPRQDDMDVALYVLNTTLRSGSRTQEAHKVCRMFDDWQVGSRSHWETGAIREIWTNADWEAILACRKNPWVAPAAAPACQPCQPSSRPRLFRR